MRPQLRLIPLLLGTALSLVSAAPLMSQMQTDLSEFEAGTPPSFDDPSEALDRLKTVLSANDVDGLASLLGLSAAKLRSSNEAMISYGIIREGAARQLQLQDVEDRKVVLVGDVLWPMPFPLSKNKDGKWAFDTEVGLQEIVNRRVGQNELATIRTMHDYVNAQYQYAQIDEDEDGVYEFAQRLISSSGKRDGLYWEPGLFDEESPAGHLIETAASGKAKRGEGYYGYRYRILTAQGSNVIGGKQNYIVNGNMTAGFALIAWPVTYRVTGVQTFIVNGANIVYQRDLGPETEQLVSTIKEFNPDENWTIVRD
ncbi:Protein of unknown function [Rhizobium tibeticum]|uniref:DUF2950 domain-containing protein n=1 Tax=Rhizobium tibeticum TaxID=501024 RepID=A0A1H8KRQ7_9HYPH|nr:DUF2950 family protein [Rhizobium tibeticum]SEH83454.1 hypothetical protein RTCCBAU85039_2615 [Rhizobium tibeticum]SEN95501.1 Protein of unknown function [Rhizobium tibeticum]